MHLPTETIDISMYVTTILNTVGLRMISITALPPLLLLLLLLLVVLLALVRLLLASSFESCREVEEEGEVRWLV